MSLPPLASLKLSELSAQLEKDLAGVHASEAPRELKESIVQQVGRLRKVLHSLDDLETLGDWAPAVRPAFAQLTEDLTTALNLQAAGRGACKFTNADSRGEDCIFCTAEQCENLGGRFFPGIPCR